MNRVRCQCGGTLSKRLKGVVVPASGDYFGRSDAADSSETRRRHTGAFDNGWRGAASMKLTMGCNAAWYELNISSADNCVSACCFYGGKKDPWSDEFRSVDEYWNSPHMQTIRRINSNPD